MTYTATGAFPIGFRIGWSPWQKDLSAVCRFARENRFAFVDVASNSVDDVRRVRSSGLQIGTVDFVRPWDGLASADAGQRKNAIAQTAAHVKACVELGVRTFFVVVFPDDPERKRSESLALAAEGYGQLCGLIQSTGAKIAIEGYPGSAPHYSALSCTPEGYREFFRAVGSDVLGVNYDPSHLIRMGIDPVRFLDEFADRVWHVHAKDTALLPDGLYEFGNLQPATLAAPHGYGGHCWRYTIPGQGNAPWPTLLKMLRDRGYKGLVSVELEDENFNGSEAGEKRGLVESREFLART